MSQKQSNILSHSQPIGATVQVIDPSCGSGANTCLPPVVPEAIASSTALAIKNRNDIYQERLRQARESFNLALWIAAVSASISFAGMVWMFLGNVPAGAAMTGGGCTSVAVWLKLAKDANDRLDKIARILEEES